MDGYADKPYGATVLWFVGLVVIGSGIVGGFGYYNHGRLAEGDHRGVVAGRTDRRHAAEL